MVHYSKGGHYWPHFDSRHLHELRPWPEDVSYETYQVIIIFSCLSASASESSRPPCTTSDACLLLCIAPARQVRGGFPHAARFLTVLIFLSDLGGDDAGGGGGHTMFPLSDEPSEPSEDRVNALSSKVDTPTAPSNYPPNLVFTPSQTLLSVAQKCALISVLTQQGGANADDHWRHHSVACEKGLRVQPRAGSALLFCKSATRSPTRRPTHLSQ